MKTLVFHIKKYFDLNKAKLERNYPGIKLNNLVDSFAEFANYSSGSELDLLPKSHENYLTDFLQKISSGIPLEYISSEAHFYGREFYVNESVLIPRFETEVLVEKVVDFLKDNNNRIIPVAEVGVGSGIVGLSVISELSDKTFDLWGSDISEKALVVANKNKDKLHFDRSQFCKVNFKNGDRLVPFLGKKFDCIFSNPPYIKQRSDRTTVHPQVVEYEPHEALFLEDEIYDEWFMSLFRDVDKMLNKGGAFFMEGHETHLGHLKKMIEQNFHRSAKLITDLTGRLRVLKMS